MAVDLYLIDYNGTPALDADGAHRARLIELGRAIQWVSQQPPNANKKIVVGPEAFLGVIPVDGYNGWSMIDNKLEEFCGRFPNVLIIPGSILWTWRGQGGNTAPIWYDGKQIMNVYKSAARGALDGYALGGNRTWRDRSFFRSQPLGWRKSQIFTWENYTIGVEICNDFRSQVIYNQLDGRLLDFHIVPSRSFWLTNGPLAAGGGPAVGVNHQDITADRTLADQGYVIQCEGTGETIQQAVPAGANIDPPIVHVQTNYPPAAGAGANPAVPPAPSPYRVGGPHPMQVPNNIGPDFYRWRKLMVYQRDDGPPATYSAVRPSGFKRPALATTYISKMFYWLNLG